MKIVSWNAEPDTKAGQIFTLAHALAHLWVGATALSDADLTATPSVAIERWCSQVAAEFLVPERLIVDDYVDGDDLTEQLDRLARAYKVSTLVVLRSIHDVA